MASSQPKKQYTDPEIDAVIELIFLHAADPATIRQHLDACRAMENWKVLFNDPAFADQAKLNLLPSHPAVVMHLYEEHHIHPKLIKLAFGSLLPKNRHTLRYLVDENGQVINSEFTNMALGFEMSFYPDSRRDEDLEFVIVNFEEGIIFRKKDLVPV